MEIQGTDAAAQGGERPDENGRKLDCLGQEVLVRPDVLESAFLASKDARDEIRTRIAVATRERDECIRLLGLRQDALDRETRRLVSSERHVRDLESALRVARHREKVTPQYA